MTVFRALVGRFLARHAADRTVVLGGVLLLASVGLGASFVAMSLSVSSSGGPELAAVFRTACWARGSGMFDALLVLITVVLGANQVHRDVRDGTLFGILARPVPRSSVFLAGWSSSVAVVGAMEAVRSGIVLGGAAWLENRIDPIHVLGALASFAGTVLLLTAFAALGSVLSPAYAVLAGAGVMIAAQLAYSEIVGGAAGRILDALAWVIPLAVHQRRTILDALQGSTGETALLAEILAYRLCWIALLLLSGMLAFSRRDLRPRP